MPPRTLHIAAACLIDDDGRLLLVRKRGTRVFMLPGGKREALESPLQTLARELDEELNLQLPDAAFTPLGHFNDCLLYTSPSPRDRQKSRMPSSA